jgi:hypothetical protein
MQDFTGVPAVVDLAAMRDAMKALGGNAEKINPQVPVHLVIDHSVMVDEFGTPKAFEQNVELEYSRNMERYQFLKWGAAAFDNFKVVPPGTGICHQVNLEHIARSVWSSRTIGPGNRLFRHLVGTDSHTTMVNGLGVLGWGVGGIEAEAAMLGQPVSMLIPEVIGFHLSGALAEGITATDLVLTVTQMLRKKGVVGPLRRILRPGRLRALGRGPGDDRQHGARIWRDLRLLSGRRQDIGLSPPHRPKRGADRAGRSLCQGAGHVARRGRGGPGVHRYAGARHGLGRALARRPQAAPGQGAAFGRGRGIPRQPLGRIWLHARQREDALPGEWH